MAAKPADWAADLLHIWFDQLEPSDWFSKNDAVDAVLRDHFEDALKAADSLPISTFLTDPETVCAAILLFDQIPRNIYRNNARAFAFDAKAVRLAKAAIAKGWDEGLPEGWRQFVAMPLMHSENLADQEESAAYFGLHLPDNVAFALSHHAMIARFGRFPHRNTALGRKSSAEEQRATDEGFSW